MVIGKTLKLAKYCFYESKQQSDTLHDDVSLIEKSSSSLVKVDKMTPSAANSSP